jgi:hypothetical protein
VCVIFATAPLRSSLWAMAEPDMIRTPDQRVRVFVSSTLDELAAERQAVRDAVSRPRLVPVMFELGARPYPPRPVYRAYLAQSQVFVGIYWQSYGWVAPGEQVSELEDEYELSAGLSRRFPGLCLFSGRVSVVRSGRAEHCRRSGIRASTWTRLSECANLCR